MTIEKPLILIVEDQKINREILKGILSSDYRVVEAVNGKDALKALSQSEEIATILLDLVMPEMDGYEFLKKIKNTRFEEIPVIAVTGSIEEGTEQEVLDLGARDFVTKPYQPMTLLSRLKNVINNAQSYTLSDIMLSSLKDPIVIFRVGEEGARAIGQNKLFDKEIVPLFLFDRLRYAEEQISIPEAELPKIKKAFADLSESKPLIEVDANLKTMDGKMRKTHLTFKYWGKDGDSVIAIVVFGI
jgi:CheY-like chemotaxis protein